MGLDQYLTKRNYVKNWGFTPEEQTYRITVQRGDGGDETTIKPTRIRYILEEIGYWRKANHIHKWFVDNVQDGNDNCGEYFISDDQLEELLTLCKRVVEDPTLGEELLPTRNGFFFGGTEYDEYYLQTIQQTIDIIEPLLDELKLASEMEEYPEVYYSSSW
jgi:hypothetical protein